MPWPVSSGLSVSLHFPPLSLSLSLSPSLLPYSTNGKSTGLVETGLYRYVRHPMYSGLLLAIWSFPTMVSCTGCCDVLPGDYPRQERLGLLTGPGLFRRPSPSPNANSECLCLLGALHVYD